MKKLAAIFLICAWAAQAADMSIQRSYTSAQIPSHPFVEGKGKAQAPLPSAVEFQPSGPPRIVDKYLLVLKGNLKNPLGQDVVLTAFGGNQINPFSLQPLDGRNFRWSTTYPLSPPAPAIAMTQVIPAHSQVEYEAQFDLGRLEYEGTPTARFEWRFGFYKQREAQTGTVAVVLPDRSESK